jgi:hypothetical protein
MIAEKVETMIFRRDANTRERDTQTSWLSLIPASGYERACEKESGSRSTNRNTGRQCNVSALVRR